jgi:hypothetical protein
VSISIDGRAPLVLPHLRKACEVLHETNGDRLEVVSDQEWFELDRLLRELGEFRERAMRSARLTGNP